MMKLRPTGFHPMAVVARAVVMLLLLPAVFTPLSAAVPGRIIFTANWEGQDDLYLMNADGSGLQRLTDQGDIREHKWSPDGGRILYFTDSRSNRGLYILDLAAKSVIALDKGAPWYRDIYWSPDGTMVMFNRITGLTRQGEEIRIVKSDGAKIAVLATDKDEPNDPSWSPDSAKVLLTLKERIYLMKPAGTERIRLINDAASKCLTPAWSPDGKSIAFLYRNVLQLKEGLYQMAADGGPPVPLARAEYKRLWRPYWSPDGRYIAFARRTSTVRSSAGDLAGIYDLCVLDRNNGKEAIYPFGFPDYSGDPLWSPDGTKIIVHGGFQSTSVVEPIGQRICQRIVGDQASWSPDSSMICFRRLESGLSRSTLVVARYDMTNATLPIDWKGGKVGGPLWAPN